MSAVARQPSTPHIIDCDVDPLLSDRWMRVEEHEKGGQLAFDPSNIELYLDDNQKDGGSIDGYELRKELADKSTFVLNANVLDYLLANSHLIPKEWTAKRVFFWGTIYRRDGSLCVRCLCWGDGRWYGGYYWLGSIWHSDCPAAVRVE